jgi:hypothetical protein
MEIFEYMLVRWVKTSIVGNISTFSASGEEKKYRVGLLSEGDIEFTKVMNELGQNGWQIMGSNPYTDSITTTIYVHLQRKTS